mmetsp:Transcript_2980/g.11464  ORF Transcript_2980/g.11464 Transcript_2980/m.11464 type:complete len:238 (-) Transcript_2980:212-925(-)
MHPGALHPLAARVHFHQLQDLKQCACIRLLQCGMSLVLGRPRSAHLGDRCGERGGALDSGRLGKVRCRRGGRCLRPDRRHMHDVGSRCDRQSDIRGQRHRCCSRRGWHSDGRRGTVPARRGGGVVQLRHQRQRQLARRRRRRQRNGRSRRFSNSGGGGGPLSKATVQPLLPGPPSPRRWCRGRARGAAAAAAAGAPEGGRAHAPARHCGRQVRLRERQPQQVLLLRELDGVLLEQLT